MRTITTVAELDGLPPQSVVSNESGTLFLKSTSVRIPGYLCAFNLVADLDFVLNELHDLYGEPQS